MHWVAFAIVTYVVCVMQTTAIAFIEVHSIRPCLPAMVAVFYALTARKADALLACALIGLAADLNGLSFHARANVGVTTLTYGLAALATIRLREILFRDHLLSYVLLVMLWTLASELAQGLFLLTTVQDRPPLGQVAAAAFYTSVYTVALAPYVHWLLRRLRNPLGLSVMRTYRVRN